MGGVLGVHPFQDEIRLMFWLPPHDRCRAPEPMSLTTTISEICFRAYALPQSCALGP